MVHEYHWDELQDKDEYIIEIEPEYEWCEDEDPSGNIVHEYGIEDEQTMLQKTSKEKMTDNPSELCHNSLQVRNDRNGTD